MKKFFNAMKNKNDQQRGIDLKGNNYTNVDSSKAQRKGSHLQNPNAGNNQINPNVTNQYYQRQRYYQKGFKDSDTDETGLFTRFLNWWADFVRRRITEPFEKTLLSAKVYGKVVDRKFSITDSLLHAVDDMKYVYHHRAEYKAKYKNAYYDYQTRFVNYGDRKFLKGLAKAKSLKNARTRFWLYTGTLTVLCISAAVMGAKVPGMYMQYKIQNEIKALEQQKREMLEKTKQRNSQAKTENVEPVGDKAGIRGTEELQGEAAK